MLPPPCAIKSQRHGGLVGYTSEAAPTVPMQAPTQSPLLEGRWKLLYTTRPGTASPIQRSFTGVDAFTVFQVSPPSPPL